MTTTVTIVSPGAMGGALGRGYREGGARVLTCVTGRSPRTRALAHGLELTDTLDDAVAAADVVLSIVPPGQALAAAAAIRAAATATGSRPLVADLNAVSPATVARVHEVLAAAGLPADLFEGFAATPSGRLTPETATRTPDLETFLRGTDLRGTDLRGTDPTPA
ncbi:hypothetical protein FAIPA1_100009 [Frankia sp. AiPs1]|uniref:NAD(P)-binding domain-containing protein n=1 Tax=Frankia sp. AiPa1 TaxID=573492 RepID=UPI00202B650D|nr:NAD(P)-binding domain-containing protein [Frankia sp. AiPa1]MCL9760959.1 NAD(P)-binding domain-containing protein [Frankia sp. AiPa1]